MQFYRPSLIRFSPILLGFTLACAARSISPPEPLPQPSGHLSAAQRISWWEEKLESASNPYHRAEARQGLGLAYLELGHAEKARAFLRKAQVELPYPAQRAKVQSAIGESYLREGDFINAQVELHQAVEELPFGAERDRGLFLLSLALELAGNPTQAAALRKQIRNVEVFASLESAIRNAPHLQAPAVRSMTPALAKITILPRARWNPAPIHNNYDPMGTITRLTVHHSADVFYANDAFSAKREIQRIQRYHQHDLGWADIGYHLLIDRQGRIWEGRPLKLQGAHAGAGGTPNQGNIGICLLGNFIEQSVSPQQAQALSSLLTYLLQQYHIAPEKIYTHQEISKQYHRPFTECPGTALQRIVENMRNDFRHGRNLRAPMEASLNK